MIVVAAMIVEEVVAVRVASAAAGPIQLLVYSLAVVEEVMVRLD